MKLVLSLTLAALALAGGSYAIDRRAERRAASWEAEWPPEGQLIEVNGVTVHAVVTGAGPDLVLLHGASGNLRDYTYSLAGRLSDRYRVIAFDRPGLGYTDRLPSYGGLWERQGESPGEQAALLAQAAAQLGADKPLVLGHSYGGAVAMAWALDHPAAGVINLAGATQPWPGELGRLYDVIGSRPGGAVVPPVAAAMLPSSYIEEAVEAVFSPQPAPDGYRAHIGPELSIRSGAIRANYKQVDSLYPHVEAMSQRYGDLDLPLEIVHGDADTSVPLAVHSLPLSEQVPGANLTILSGVGHMPHHSDEDAVVAAIDRAAERAGLR